ncbi:MAG: Transaldolase [Calditrichaeota bacterium]|nr:Transaldolase [Calditrichota bacterium]
MKLFIDSADVNEIREAQEMGVLDGVTTNPSLVAKTGRSFDECAREIVEMVDGPVSLEVVATDCDGMVREAEQLVNYGPNVVVKIPLIRDGLKATKTLSERGIKVNNTLCFSPMQALLSAKAGSSYISPFVGRLDDISHDGMEVVAQIIEIYANYVFETEVLVASVRNPLHLVAAATMGADVATVPFNVIGRLLKHPLTEIGLKRFLDDWKNVPEG